MPEDRLENISRRVCKGLKLAVQIKEKGEEFEPVLEEYMCLNIEHESKNYRVAFHGVTGLDALFRHKELLSDQVVIDLVQAMVEMSVNRSNGLANREMLLARLGNFADRVDQDLADEVVRSIHPLACGNGITAAVPLGGNEGARQLTPGSPEQVQGLALIAIASFDRRDGAASGLVQSAISDGFVHESSTVRRGAFAASRKMPWLSSEQAMPVIFGLRDPDPMAAATAFAAITERTEWDLNGPMSKLVLLAAQFACRSAEVTLRRHAAHALRSLGTRVAPSSQVDVEKLLRDLNNDIAFSVRQAAAG